MIKNFLVASILLFESLTSIAVPLTPFVEGQNILTQTKIKIDASEKKGLVVVFLSAKCPCSNSHNVELIDLAKTYSDFNFVVIHSNTDESIETSKTYFEKATFPFPVIEDEKTKIADSLQAFKTPHAYIFSSQGEELYQGGVSDSSDFKRADKKYLRNALSDLQAGNAVKLSKTRVLGCVISRGEKNVF